MYEDDGISFGHRKGDWMGIEVAWNDQGRRLKLDLAEKSSMQPRLARRIEVKWVAERTTIPVIFAGKSHEVHLSREAGFPA